MHINEFFILFCFLYFIYTDSESPTRALGYVKEFLSSMKLIIKEMCWFANFQECDPLVKNVESKKCEFGKCCCFKILAQVPSRFNQSLQA